MWSKRGTQITISVSGCFGENNAGDDILLVALLRGIKAKFDNCRFVVFTADRKNTKKICAREHIPLESVMTVYSGRWGVFEPERSSLTSLLWILETFHWIYKSNLLLIGPGNPVKDDTNRFKLMFYFSRAFLAYLLKTPFACVGIGVGKVTWNISRLFFKKIGNKAAFISTRDSLSADELSDLGIHATKVISLADLSFCQTIQLSELDTKSQMSPNIIGFNTRQFSSKHYSASVIENYYDCLLSWCKWVISTSGSRLIFFPFCEEEHQSDLPIYNRLVSDLVPHSHLIDIYRYHKFYDLRRYIAQCDLFLGTRFHSVLLSAQQYVPVLALSYEEKTYKFMKQVGLEEYVIRTEELTFELLKHRWKRLYASKESLREHLKIIKQQETNLALAHFELIMKAVRK
jgi:polysaccharide pyruvyl transferase WcaK-like protein